MTPDTKAMTVALASIDRERVLASRTVFLTRAWVMRDGGAMTVWRIVGTAHDERQVEDLVVGNLQRQVWSQGDEDNRGGNTIGAMRTAPSALKEEMVMVAAMSPKAWTFTRALAPGG